jgi:hypothetical protein
VKCKTKPISGHERLGAGRTNKANSGFRPNPGPIMQDKPNIRLRRAGRGRGAVGQMRKTNPISAVAAVETAHYSSIPSFQHSSARPQAQGQSCETKPIPATASGGAKAWRQRSYGE